MESIWQIALSLSSSAIDETLIACDCPVRCWRKQRHIRSISIGKKHNNKEIRFLGNVDGAMLNIEICSVMLRQKSKCENKGFLMFWICLDLLKNLEFRQLPHHIGGHSCSLGHHTQVYQLAATESPPPGLRLNLPGRPQDILHIHPLLSELFLGPNVLG